MLSQYKCMVSSHYDLPIIGICQNQGCKYNRRVCEQCVKELHTEENNCKQQYILTESELMNRISSHQEQVRLNMRNKIIECQIQQKLKVLEIKEYILFWQEEFKYYYYLMQQANQIMNDCQEISLETYMNSLDRDHLLNIDQYLENSSQMKLNEILQENENIAFIQKTKKLKIDFIDNLQDILTKYNRQLTQSLKMNETQMFKFMKEQDSKEEEKMIVYENFIHFFTLQADIDFQKKNSQINLKDILQDKYLQIQLCRKGKLMMQFGKLDQALIYFQKIIDINPQNFRAYLNQSLVYKSQQRYDDAFQCLSECQQIDPFQYDGYHNQALILMSQNRIDEALICYEKFIKIDRTHYEPYLQKDINLYLNQPSFLKDRNYQSKEMNIWHVYFDDANQFINQNYRNMEILIQFGIILIHKALHLIKRQLYPRAEELMEIIINKEEKQSMNEIIIKMGKEGLLFIQRVAERLVQNWSFDFAIKCWDLIMKIDPKNFQAFKKKAQLLFNYDKVQNAIECWDQLIKVDPLNTQAYIEKLILIMQDQLFRIENKIIKIDQLKSQKYINQGSKSDFTIDSIFQMQNEYQEAILCLDKLLKIDITYTEAYKIKAYQLIEYFKYQKTILCWIEILYVDDITYEVGSLYHYRALQFEEQNQYQEAISFMDELLKIDPSNTEAYKIKAYLFEEQNKYSEAILCMDELIKIDPTNTEAYQKKGSLFEEQNSMYG